MKRIILCVIFALMLTSYVFSEQAPADGPFKAYFDNGTLQTMGYYRNGKGNGVFIEYYSNGRIEMVREFKDDVLNGIFLAFHENGMLSDEGYFKMGKSIGVHKRWSEEGALIVLTENDEQGNEIKQILYDLDGNILSKTSETAK